MKTTPLVLLLLGGLNLARIESASAASPLSGHYIVQSISSGDVCNEVSNYINLGVGSEAVIDANATDFEISVMTPPNTVFGSNPTKLGLEDYTIGPTTTKMVDPSYTFTNDGEYSAEDSIFTNTYRDNLNDGNDFEILTVSKSGGQLIINYQWQDSSQNRTCVLVPKS